MNTFQIAPVSAQAVMVPRKHRPLDLICFSHLRWDFVTQRPQHLLQRAARDRRVFFWEEPIWHQPGELAVNVTGGLGKYLEVTRNSSKLWVLRPHLTWGIDFEAGQKELLDDFMQQLSIDTYVRWYYTPMALGFSCDLTATATVYDCMDELSAFRGASPRLLSREQELFSEADVVFTGGRSLYEAKRRSHSNVHLFPSSIDVAHFGKAKSPGANEPEDQRNIAHPRAGFCGVVDERFDTQLLTDVARLRPEVQFVIIGPVVKIDPAVLPRAANIHYLGSKTYHELPQYFAGWDTALLLFALNDATRFISPTKTPEYLAAGKTVVSTPITDVVRDYGNAGLVAIAGTAEAFARAIDSALAPQKASWQGTVSRALGRSSWDSTWAAMSAEIQRVCAAQDRQAAYQDTVLLPSDGVSSRLLSPGLVLTTS